MGAVGAHPPPPPRDDLRFSNPTGILQRKRNYVVFIGVEVEQETSAPLPKKNPGSAPENLVEDGSCYFFCVYSNEPLKETVTWNNNAP